MFKIVTGSTFDTIDSTCKESVWRLKRFVPTVILAWTTCW